MSNMPKTVAFGGLSLIGGVALASAFGQARKQKRIDFNPFKGDVIPVTPFGAVANTTAVCVGIYLAAAGWKDTLIGYGYNDQEIAKLIPIGFAASGVLSLVLVAERTRK